MGFVVFIYAHVFVFAICCVYIVSVTITAGKDSLSMAARVNDATVKSPGTVVISTYAACEDITKTITPDFKCPDYIGNCPLFFLLL